MSNLNGKILFRVISMQKSLLFGYSLFRIDWQQIFVSWIEWNDKSYSEYVARSCLPYHNVFISID